MDRPYDDELYSDYPQDRRYPKKELPSKGDLLDSARRSNGPSEPPRQREPFNLGKLQIAGILLIIVFVWAIISAVTIGMFEIHLLALTEFADDKRADVSGFVMDSEGRSLVNVTIAVHGTQYFTKTNQDGFYLIEDIKESDYEIEATLDGYGSLTKRVSLNANSPTMVNFVLEEGGFDKTQNERYGSNLSDLQNLNFATAIFIIVYASFAFLGGILTFLQRYYWIAMFGSLCGIIAGVLSIGIIVTPIISIIALYYIVKNKEEFITSEKPLTDRLLGVQRARTKPVGTSKGQVQRINSTPAVSAPPPPVESKAAKSRDLEEERGYVPSLKCFACGGSVKTESQGIVCVECGATYHRFCADSIGICKQCQTPL
jgi:hypothetical protein